MLISFLTSRRKPRFRCSIYFAPLLYLRIRKNLSRAVNIPANIQGLRLAHDQSWLNNFWRTSFHSWSNTGSNLVTVGVSPPPGSTLVQTGFLMFPFSVVQHRFRLGYICNFLCCWQSTGSDLDATHVSLPPGPAVVQIKLTNMSLFLLVQHWSKLGYRWCLTFSWFSTVSDGITADVPSSPAPTLVQIVWQLMSSLLPVLLWSRRSEVLEMYSSRPPH